MVTKYRYPTLYGPSEPEQAPCSLHFLKRQATVQLELTEATFTISALCLYERRKSEDIHDIIDVNKNYPIKEAVSNTFQTDIQIGHNAGS